MVSLKITWNRKYDNVDIIRFETLEELQEWVIKMFKLFGTEIIGFSVIE